MSKTKREKLRDDIIKAFKSHYGIYLREQDIYVSEGFAFLSTTATAEFLDTSYHNFSTVYVKAILGAGLTRIILGRSKFYKLNNLLTLLRSSRSKGISILDKCRELKKKQRK